MGLEYLTAPRHLQGRRLQFRFTVRKIALPTRDGTGVEEKKSLLLEICAARDRTGASTSNLKRFWGPGLPAGVSSGVRFRVRVITNAIRRGS
jgi:hypothetical protein